MLVFVTILSVFSIYFSCAFWSKKHNIRSELKAIPLKQITTVNINFKPRKNLISQSEWYVTKELKFWADPAWFKTGLQFGPKISDQLRTLVFINENVRGLLIKANGRVMWIISFIFDLTRTELIFDNISLLMKKKNKNENTQ